MTRILIIEDKDSLRQMLTDFFLETDSVLEADSAEEGEKLLNHYPEIILCDLMLPGMTGIEFIRKHKNTLMDSYFIVMTAFGDVPTAVDAMRAGAYDFLPKPLDLNHLKFVVRRVKELIRLKKKESMEEQRPIIGVSTLLKTVTGRAELLAESDVPVLISGESGSGKEVMARHIHNHSARCDNPFVAVNCAALPSDIFEAEMFGVVKGAFTGAVKDRKGFFEIADGGTLFLDEIGELSLHLQVKLLRTIETLTFSRVGSSASQSVDVRLLFATNRNLEEMTEKKLFREDLYYRVSGHSLEVPSLRARPEDIRPLTLYFARVLGQKIQGKVLDISEKAIQLLEKSAWPGNIRELKNTIEKWAILYSSVDESAVDLTGNSSIHDGNISLNIENMTYTDVMQDAEEKLLRYSMIQCNHNKQAVARKLGMNYKTLLTKLKKAGL